MENRTQAGRAAQQSAAPDAPFLLASRQGTLVAHGVASVVACPSQEDLVSCLTAHFSRARGRAAGARMPVVVGALPFSTATPVHLYEPVHVDRTGQPLSPLPVVDLDWTPQVRWRVQADPSPADYVRRVRRALELIADGPDTLQKVVLGRRLLLEADAPIDVRRLVARLANDPDATTFAVPLPSGPGGQARTLVGATPELLLEKIGGLIRSEPMAGSARRSDDAVEDRARADGLLRSEKDRREHAAVVEWVADRLAPYCHSLKVPATPQLRATRTMWHLVSPIEGDLHDPDTPSVGLATALHPTPAVCGVPYDAAVQTIADLEPFDRRFFTGAVGWCDESGNGRWMVTIRCGEISGRRAELYAGAGIVAGSSPEAECAETAAKFGALLNALDVPAEGIGVDEPLG